MPCLYAVQLRPMESNMSDDIIESEIRALREAAMGGQRKGDARLA